MCGVYDQVKNQTMAVADGANLPKAGLDKLFPGTNINIGILIAILCVILIYIILNKTTFGYELKACGKNPNASKYAGINAKKSIVLSLCEKSVLLFAFRISLGYFPHTDFTTSSVTFPSWKAFITISTGFGLTSRPNIFLILSFMSKMKS